MGFISSRKLKTLKSLFRKFVQENIFKILVNLLMGYLLIILPNFFSNKYRTKLNLQYSAKGNIFYCHIRKLSLSKVKKSALQENFFFRDFKFLKKLFRNPLQENKNKKK